MIDAPGPWGTGPFVLVEGTSNIDTEQVVISQEPFAATWLQTEDRTPLVRLVANPHYWDTARGPHLQEIVFRNDVPKEKALELVCDTEGEVDIVTAVSPRDAERVIKSKHAKLITTDGMRAVVGIINRDSNVRPFGNLQARQALNHAVDRNELVKEALFGYADVAGGLTPPSVLPRPHHLKPYEHDPKQAAQLWKQSGAEATQPLRIAAPEELEATAREVAEDLRDALGIQTQVTIHAGADKRELLRHLAERTQPRDWDILIWEQGGQEADAPPLEFHRAFVGRDGEFAAGPALSEFEVRYADLVNEQSPIAQLQISHEIDKYVYEEALLLFLYAPHTLYAVNQHINFTTYRTTFELAECHVSAHHWSRREKSG